MSTIRVNNMTNVGGTGPTYASGMVIQTVTANTTTAVTNNSNTYIDTGLTASITPKSINSKILITVTHSAIGKGPGSSENRTRVRLMRNGSVELATTGGLLLYTASAIYNVAPAVLQFLDTPVSTSAITYNTQFQSTANVAQVTAQYDAGMSTITLQEIAA